MLKLQINTYYYLGINIYTNDKRFIMIIKNFLKFKDLIFA
jgi:hypothetical protein